LRAAGHPKITVVNAGIPGYGTYQETILFERIVDEVLPDAVLVGFFLGNDFADNLKLNNYEVIDGYLVYRSLYGKQVFLAGRLGIPAAIKIMLRTRLHLYTFLMNAWSRVLVAVGGEYTQDPVPMTTEAVEATRDALLQLQIACRKRKLPLALILIPNVRLVPAMARKDGYQSGRAADIVREIAATEGIPVLDLDWMTKESDLTFPVDYHWNARGHLVTGRAIAQSLLEGELRLLLDQL